MGQARPEEAGYGVLAEMVAQLRYKPGWTFHLHWGPSSSTSVCSQADLSQNLPVTSGSASLGLSFDFTVAGRNFDYQPLILDICVLTEDSQHPGCRVTVTHPQVVPHPSLRMPWHIWLKQCILAVEMHEIGEWFEIAGQRPFYPEHGPGADLYALRDRGLEWPPARSAVDG